MIRIYLIMFYCLAWLCLPKNGYSQQENIWMWGDLMRGYGLDFNSGAPLPFPVNSSVNGWEANASVCDEKGKFLFYTNGDEVWNKDQVLMPNGGNLVSVSYHPVNSTHQGAVIVPFPDGRNQYYIFSLGAITGGSGPHAGILYYSIVDMNLDAGLGDVVAGSKGISLDSGFFEGITAVAGERCNVWLLTRSKNTGDLKAYDITAAGISPEPVSSPVFPLSGTILNRPGSIKVAPDRRKIICTDINYRMMNFDPNTGKASHPVKLAPTDFLNLGAHIPEFSPDNTKVYLRDPYIDSIYQYNITLNNVESMHAERLAISNVDSFTCISFKLGPDGRIYFNRDGKNIDRINEPDLPGLACGHEKAAIPGMAMVWGGPNVVPVVHRDTAASVTTFTEPGCWQQAISLEPGDTFSFNHLWSTGSTRPYIAVDAPGSYQVNYYTPSCTYHSDTFLVAFPHGPLPQLATEAQCGNAPHGKAWVSRPHGDPALFFYTWMNQAGDTLSQADTLKAAAGRYKLHVSSFSGCDTTLLLEIPLIDPRAGFGATDTLICLGTGIEFFNTSDGHFDRFHWRFGNGDSSSELQPQYIYPEAGKFNVTLVATGKICKDTVVQAIIVDAPLSRLTFSKSRDSICTGEAIFFQHHPTETLRNITWSLDTGSWFSGNATAFHHAFDRSGDIPMVLAAQFRACPEMTTRDTLHVYPLPLINLGPDNFLCMNGRPLLLENKAGVKQGDSYQWSTGVDTQVLQVSRPGRYSLTVTTAQGCSSTEHVEVIANCYLDIPNAFSPNEDGINDYFFPRPLMAVGLSSFRMQVFSRWGQLLFATTQQEGKGWDGRYNHIAQPPGVYVYRIDIQFKSGIAERYEGNMTLLR